MGIAVDGIVSGLDTTSIVQAMVAAYSVNQSILEDKLDGYEDKLEAVAGVVSRMEDLKAALEELDSATEFRAFTAASSDEDAVGVTADGEAIAGTYALTVSNLATVEMEASQGFASNTADDTVATGTYSITYGGVTTEFTLDATDSSLQDMADAINENVDGVTAYIVNNGSGTNPYQLVLVGEDTGADNTISFSAVSTTGPGAEPTFTQMQAAEDAVITVNGITIQSDSNEVTDAVPGLTLQLTQETASAVTITVAQDTETIQAKIQAFVDAYNEVVSYVNTNTVYNYDEDIRGPLVGESGVSRVMQGLSSVITGAYESGSTITSLGFIGISTGSDGTLEFDTEAFVEALRDHPDEVEALFTDDTGFGAAMIDKIDVYIDDDGTLASRTDSLESRIEDLEEAIDDWDDRIDRYEERLLAQFEAMEVTLGELSATEDYLAALLSDNDDDD